MSSIPRSGADRHSYCFVPAEEIDIVVLAAYLQAFIDSSATIKPSRHPRDRDRLGFTVGAASTLGREHFEDLIKDTKDWEKEQDSRVFEDCPYNYQDSDTWAYRKRLRRTPPGTSARVVEGRHAKERQTGGLTTSSQPTNDTPSNYYTQPSNYSRHSSIRSDDTWTPSVFSSSSCLPMDQNSPSSAPRSAPYPYINTGPAKRQAADENSRFNETDSKHSSRDKRSQRRGSREGEQDPNAGGPRPVPESLNVRRLRV